jgi:hypothetical protein
MQKELDSSIVTILVEVLDTSSVETRGTTDNTMDLKEKERKQGGCESVGVPGMK